MTKKKVWKAWMLVHRVTGKFVDQIFKNKFEASDFCGGIPSRAYKIVQVEIKQVIVQVEIKQVEEKK